MPEEALGSVLLEQLCVPVLKSLDLIVVAVRMCRALPGLSVNISVKFMGLLISTVQWIIGMDFFL